MVNDAVSGTAAGTRPAATVVLLRPGADGAQLLLMQRNPRAGAFRGAVVFPGGVVDPADSHPRALARLRGADAPAADLRLGLAGGALSHWVAAVRECYEEAGLLLAVDASGRVPDARRLAPLARARAALHRGTLSFADFLEAEELWIETAALTYFAHWITPPDEARRFDTRFFMALAPAEQAVSHDATEMQSAVWLTPAEALARCARGELRLAFATERVVRDLSSFTDPAAMIAHARAQSSIEASRPCSARGRAGRRWFTPGDPEYAEVLWCDPAQSGTGSYELTALQPRRLDAHVLRIVAPNAGPLTGPGTNTYVLGGETGRIVIDPGPAAPAHLEAVLQAGAGPIRAILLTHTHLDHAGGAMALAARTGAPLIGRTPRAPIGEDTALTFQRQVGDGERVAVGGLELVALLTPGHASNHICWLLPATGMLFTGDHIMQGSTVVIAPPDGSMREYLQSLESVRRAGAAILAPGHGYLIGRPEAEVERLLRHRAARESRVLEALAAAGAPASAQALLPVVYADVPAAMHPWAALSLQAHLDKLLEDGRVRQDAAGYVLTPPESSLP